MIGRGVVCAIAIAFFCTTCRAQDITDVEAKPYGSYTGGAIDTVDLATGNLMLNIPLISFPQKGSLPPLSFSIEANNAPYSQSGWNCDAEIDCLLLSARYDTSPPGAVYQYQDPSTAIYLQQVTGSTAYETCLQVDNPDISCSQVIPYWGVQYATFQNMGAYLSSSFEGGITTGQLVANLGSGQYANAPAWGGYQYSLIDPSGRTHELESDASSLNTYRAPDGSGYTFIPSGTGNAYDPEDPENLAEGSTGGLASMANWIANPASETSGARLGTVYSPTGIQYTTSILPYSIPTGNTTIASQTNNEAFTPRALRSVARDPSGNTITRGPWYWSGYWSHPNTEFTDIQAIYNSTPPQFVDSVNRVIPDIIAMQATMSGPMSGPTLTWNVPGPGSSTLQYVISYTPIANSMTFDPQGQGGIPDPFIDIHASGWAISSVTLPNGTQWQFAYDGADLKSITTPGGGTITYAYTTVPFNSVTLLGRCNSTCHAVQSRTETDGLTGSGQHSWRTTYSYNSLATLQNCPPVQAGGVQVVFAFATTETDPLGNDTVHSFCAVGITNGSVPVANQYREIQTDYYQGPASNSKRLKTVQTQFESQLDISQPYNGGQLMGLINVLPTHITTTTPFGSGTVSKAESRQYSNDASQPLFVATRVACGWYWPQSPGQPIYGEACNTHGFNLAGATSIPISYESPTTEKTTDASGNLLSTTTTTFEFQNPGTGFLAANMVALPLSVQVSAGTPGYASYVSDTTAYGYDENIGCSPGPFGYLTSKAESFYLGATITTRTAYNCQGMPVTKFDGNGNATAITYDGTGLFASKIQRPTTSGVQHIDYYSYDLNTGNLNWHTDENGSAPGDAAHTTTFGHDALGRVISIQYPGGGGSAFCYTDTGGSICEKGIAPFSLYTNTIATPDPSIATTHTYDGWGRQFKSSVTSDPLGATNVDTSFDFEGRVTSVSNPYRTTPAPNDPPSGVTSYVYDALGRKTIQTQPDGTIQQWCYDGVVTTGQSNCSANAMSSGQFTPTEWTDISDETGRHSQQVFDALGRMGAVIEPDPASGSLAMETDYSYDPFGDLLTVNQLGTSGSHPVWRDFAYDMPSRVSWACNPEATMPAQHGQDWRDLCGVQYMYDGNSNLVQKTDGRGIVTNYLYDALNRLTSKTYVNPPFLFNGEYYPPHPPDTASSCYQYDSATNGSGKLGVQWTEMTGNQYLGVYIPSCPSTPPGTGVLTKTTISAYDAMGRIVNEQRCAGVSDCSGAGYTMGYTYDLAGKLLSYPSGFGGFSFGNTYDASGRLLTVNGTANSVTTPLFTVPIYTPAGALSGVQLGSALNMTRTYDSRQRVTSETDSHP